MSERLVLPLLVGAVSAAVIGAGVLVYQAVLGDPGGRTWTAEFTNARGLVTGNDVRDDGAVVGRVTSIGLSLRGTALVRFQLSDRAAAPRADAVAAIEPADLLGDNYLSLSPGSAHAPLPGDIPADRTVDAPRLDELLDSFQPDVRDGLQELLLEGGLALDQRGGSLARATVALRPALQAAGGVLDELNTQDGSLARLIPAAERAAAQLSSRSPDLGPLLDDLSRTLGATAGAGTALGAGLAALPATLAQLRGTAGGLSSTSAAATALAAKLEPETGALADATSGLPALAGRARSAAPALSRAIRSVGSVLAAGQPAFAQLDSALPALGSQAPRISALLAELDQAAPGIAQGFFVDFPDEADESGRQPLDPFADPRRAYWRGAAVFSCEAFGVPVAAGCLDKALANLARQPPPSPAPARRAPVNTIAVRPPANPTAVRPPANNPTAVRPPVNPTAVRPPANPTAVRQLLGFLLGR